jgi:S-adenosylmethionine:tRNA ribosyltransferase-isomerase
LQWNGEQTFAEILTKAGVTPLPPYINRQATHEDATRYQTIYSQYEGAVAAPTAGLHFTNEVFDSLRTKKIVWDFLTLHVSAGTFQPVKAENALAHTMHHEQIVVSRQTIDTLLNPDRFIVAVGTTSLRTLESLYWYGTKLLENPDAVFAVTQTDPYKKQDLPASGDALRAVARYMDTRAVQTITGITSIYIYPGYRFKICKGLITNFHQPASTLMLLVAAFIGEDWKTIYAEALHNDYRFLSYGDASLLLP